ncbi:MAG TPA: conjugal transfer protein TraR [Flexistipes sinusarabici]|uniref:Conjugal transfer protein TraR n=1 Tax=Flexistipes sinusarabici TaxID=2352 RepID=A0A3D5QBQ6_FLESI|nr:conjugal transfer protein TraR [Flexistipes sinusarabici]
MEKNKKEEIKKQVISLIQELEQEIAELNENDQTVAPDNAIGRLSRMEAMQAQNINNATLNNKRKRLIRLKDTLGKIDSLHFGECKACGEEIEINRLRASPEANVCSECIRKNQKK